MRLTPEEQKKLSEGIMDDLPENFAIFSPWTSLFLVQIFSLLFSGVLGAVMLLGLLSLPPAYVVGFVLFAVCPLVIAPNIILSTGKTDLGMRLIRLSAKLFILMSLAVIFLSIHEALRFLVGACVSAALACLTHFITGTLKFQQFALHRAQMAVWSKERIRKNKAFKNAIKNKRRGQ